MIFLILFFLQSQSFANTEDSSVNVLITNPLDDTTTPTTRSGGGSKNHGTSSSIINSFLNKDGDEENILEEDSDTGLVEDINFQAEDKEQYIIKKETSFENQNPESVKEDKKNNNEEIISKYKKNPLLVEINFPKQDFYLNGFLDLEIIFKKNNSLENFPLESILKGFLVIKDLENKVISTRHFYNSEEKIDFLEIKKNTEIKKRELKNLFFLPEKTGNYTAEIRIILATDFLEIDKKLEDSYQVEINSNVLSFTVKEKTNFFQKLSSQEKIILIFSSAILFFSGGFWFFIFYEKNKLILTITKFSTQAPELISLLKNRDTETLVLLEEYVKNNYKEGVEKSKILSALNKFFLKK